MYILIAATASTYPFLFLNRIGVETAITSFQLLRHKWITERRSSSQPSRSIVRGDGQGRVAMVIGKHSKQSIFFPATVHAKKQRSTSNRKYGSTTIVQNGCSTDVNTQNHTNVPLIWTDISNKPKQSVRWIRSTNQLHVSRLSQSSRRFI